MAEDANLQKVSKKSDRNRDQTYHRRFHPHLEMIDQELDLSDATTPGRKHLVFAKEGTQALRTH